MFFTSNLHGLAALTAKIEYSSTHRKYTVISGIAVFNLD